MRRSEDRGVDRCCGGEQRGRADENQTGSAPDALSNIREHVATVVFDLGNGPDADRDDRNDDVDKDHDAEGEKHGSGQFVCRVLHGARCVGDDAEALIVHIQHTGGDQNAMPIMRRQGEMGWLDFKNTRTRENDERQNGEAHGQ